MIHQRAQRTIQVHLRMRTLTTAKQRRSPLAVLTPPVILETAEAPPTMKEVAELTMAGIPPTMKEVVGQGEIPLSQCPKESPSVSVSAKRWSLVTAFLRTQQIQPIWRLMKRCVICLSLPANQIAKRS